MALVRSRNPAARYLGPLVAAGAQQLYNYNNYGGPIATSYTNPSPNPWNQLTRRPKYRPRQRVYGGEPFNPISTHADQSTLYIKKRMPWKKKQRWRRTVNTVRAVQALDKPKLNILHTDVSTAGNTAANEQQIHFKGMYTGFGAGDPYKDMQYIMQNVAASTSTSDIEKQKARLHSAVLECTIQNDGDVAVYCDAYFVECIKSSSEQPDALLTAGYSTSSAGGTWSGSGSAIGSTSLGATPFQSPDFCQHFKIIKKTRALIGAGGSLQYEWRDPKNHIFSSTAEDHDNVCIKGLTKGWLFVMYAVPGYVTSTLQKSQAIPTNTISLTRYVTYVASNVDQGAKRVAVDT